MVVEGICDVGLVVVVFILILVIIFLFFVLGEKNEFIIWL